ncbi:myoglobin [Pristis pectinata]|uniref:myoglobin n=1 Tax=Pristis pectinata TaxID=685728 RepID=UPI00223D98E3|nr:myoglobin [Pristis pectinata]
MSDWDNVNKVWSSVEGNLPALGQAVLLRLFKEHAETKKHFPKFRDLSLDQLENNEDVRTHGNTVLQTVGKIVKKKGSHANELKALAETHIHKHKIPPHNFTLITNIMLTILTEKYPSSMTGPVKDSFSKVFQTICSDLEKLYKEANFQG